MACCYLCSLSYYILGSLLVFFATLRKPVSTTCLLIYSSNELYKLSWLFEVTFHLYGQYLAARYSTCRKISDSGRQWP